MSKPRKKLRCTCKKREYRTYPGTDNQKHAPECDLALKNRKE